MVINKPSEEEYATPLPWLEMVEQFSFLQSPYLAQNI